MIDILERLYRIAKANLPDPPEIIENFIEKHKDGIFRWKSRDEYGDWDFNSWKDGGGDQTTYGENDFKSYNSGIPRQVIDDLAVFGLVPPSSMKEVKKARNREIKKFHPDHFLNNPEKLKTAKEILQIYNAAYDRLKEYYKDTM